MKFAMHLMLASTLLHCWPCVAQQRSPASIRVINFSSQSIVSFSISGLPFRDVGLDSRWGEALTPSFADGHLDYDIYWRLADGSVHGAALDLRYELPKVFDGDVVLSIRNDKIKVSWANVNTAWIEYSRVRDPAKLPEPIGPYYAGCDGDLLEDPETVKVWYQAEARVRERLKDQPDYIADAVLRGRCDLDWYIPPAVARPRVEPNGVTAMKLRAEWHDDIERYKAAKGASKRAVR